MQTVVVSHAQEVLWGFAKDLVLACIGIGLLQFLASKQFLYFLLNLLGPKSSKAKSADGEEDWGSLISKSAAKTRFEDILGMREVKGRMLEFGRQIIEGAGTGAKRNGILLFGEPGNGKTVFAEALAGELKLPLVKIEYKDIESKFIGEAPLKMKRALEQAKSQAPCVLFIDEIDSFLLSRGEVGQNDKDGAKLVNLLLTELVEIRGHKVVLVAATNYMEKLDSAAIREGRFDFKVEITAPDEEARIGILTSSLRKAVPEVLVDKEAVLSAAKRWNGFSVARIKAVAQELPSYLKENPRKEVSFQDLMAVLRRIQGRKGRPPVGAKTLNELVLEEGTRNALLLLSKRLQDPMRVERLGGTFPRGLLFHGPSGTGKTAAAMAIALQVDWAFLSVAGADLLKEPEQLEKLFAQAKELRPTIIFIDEADDVLRDRSYSANPAIANKLLTLMDGAGDQVKDVVFIAATNNPEQIDAAMLRSGRFTEKVNFEAASAGNVSTLVKLWIKRKNARLGFDTSVYEISQMLEGQSPANIEGVLQYALNMAIMETESDDIRIEQHHVQRGFSIVTGA